ncbi:hypothetical protein WT60_06760 [Burkholderia sp. MSMB617WGS]|nr:hypothetical protein WT60_06760 [Burkholderia sp. MSMB617WGS]
MRRRGRRVMRSACLRHPASGIRHPASGIRHPARGRGAARAAMKIMQAERFARAAAQPAATCEPRGARRGARRTKRGIINEVERS